MLNAKAFANAATLIMAVWVVVCAIFAYIAPNLLFTIAQSWTHTMNLEVLKDSFNPSLGSLLLGLVSATSLTWVTTYATITLYNRFKK
ncbi:MAG: DUF5676 family membrane protein [bacterium]|nr:DUF5676 family membrane protein [bacterium]